MILLGEEFLEHQLKKAFFFGWLASEKTASHASLKH